MHEPTLAEQWNSWLTCPPERLQAQMRSDLENITVAEKTRAAMLAFVDEYRRKGENWSSQGIRGDELKAPLLELQQAAPHYFSLFCEKIALAEKFKWVGGSVGAEVLAAQTSYKKFAVVSTPRAGTHLIRTLLGSHPNIEMHGEAFNRFGQHLLPYSVSDTPVDTIIQRHLFRPWFEYVEAVGFVLFRDLDTQWGKHSVWPDLQAIPDLKLILLERKSLLQQFVSLKKSLRDQIWYFARNDSRAVSDEKIAVSLDELLPFIDENTENRLKFTEAFQHHQMLTLYYEDVVAAPETAAGEILSFLGVSELRLCAGTGRKESRPLSSVISNYPQLITTLKGTKYEPYL
ncbi:sulfotransferase [Erwinia mallotivora]|uniref:Sulfotransferase n=1 Tax=Erwinia mallotivora TaxID=69222 RepID=A0A014N840_9GAMM|nr:sulfotransferase [Erwinia mallotivora]EXU75558.1 sulfotransferase [Erwinia mallotivora]